MIRRVAVAAGTIVLSDEGGAHARRRAAGGAVVLLHGFTGSKASWRPVRAALSRTHRVIAIDLPGHGATVMKPGFDHSLERTADAVIAALDALDVGRAALVGYSMGGRLALQIACAHASRVDRLVLESASAGIATVTARVARRRADERLAAAIERDGIAAFVRRWEALPLFRSLADLPRPACVALRRARLACAPAGLAASLRGMGTGAQPWLGPRLAALRVPVLLVAGTRDPKFTRLARTLARRIPGARFASVAGAGHVPHLEQPRSFLDVVRPFLDVGTRAHDQAQEDRHAHLMDRRSHVRGHHLSTRRRDRPHRHQPSGSAERVSSADRDGAARRVHPRP